MTLANKIYLVFCAALVLLAFWVGGAFGDLSSYFIYGNDWAGLEVSGPLSDFINCQVPNPSYGIRISQFGEIYDGNKIQVYTAGWSSDQCYAEGNLCNCVASRLGPKPSGYYIIYKGGKGYAYIYWDTDTNTFTLPYGGNLTSNPAINILNANNEEISSGDTQFAIDFIDYTDRRFDISWQNNWSNYSSTITIYTGSDNDYNFTADFSDFDFNVDGNWYFVLEERTEAGELLNTLYDGIVSQNFYVEIAFTNIDPVLYCGQYDGDEVACTARSPACVFSSLSGLCLAPNNPTPTYPNGEDFSDWYASNSSGEYETPTPLAAAIGGFLYNIFSPLGDALTGLSDNFNLTDAFNKGQSLGEIFPKATSYIGFISPFIGGFPLALIIKILVLAILAVIIIKIIFKFIPFFG
jgi:hypothetical protein